MKRILVAAVLVSCATTSTAVEKPGARGLRASEHLDAADRESELARQRLAYPVMRGDLTGSAPLVPWTRSWDSNEDHDRLARLHRSAAARLQAEYDEACNSVPADRIAISPLHEHAIGGTTTKDGAVIYLAADVMQPSELLRDMRCHRAWMMLGPTDMSTCPLDLAGIQVTATGDADGIAVTITVRDHRLVGELQRRAAVEVET